jgi:hypothetical protein
MFSCTGPLLIDVRPNLLAIRVAVVLGLRKRDWLSGAELFESGPVKCFNCLRDFAFEIGESQDEESAL